MSLRVMQEDVQCVAQENVKEGMGYALLRIDLWNKDNGSGHIQFYFILFHSIPPEVNI